MDSSSYLVVFGHECSCTIPKARFSIVTRPLQYILRSPTELYHIVLLFYAKVICIRNIQHLAYKTWTNMQCLSVHECVCVCLCAQMWLYAKQSSIVKKSIKLFMNTHKAIFFLFLRFSFPKILQHTPPHKVMHKYRDLWICHKNGNTKGLQTVYPRMIAVRLGKFTQKCGRNSIEFSTLQL